ncbi:DUF5926 family protein [Micromonospora sp. M12]
MRDVFVPRPFDGLIDESEWIALRELVPAASAPLRLAPALVEEFGDRAATLATVLPMAAPAITKPDGRVLIGLQRHQQSGDVSGIWPTRCSPHCGPSRAARWPCRRCPAPALASRTSSWTARWTSPCTGLRLLARPGAADDPTVQASLERANAAIYPTVRLTAAKAAYWCQVRRRHTCAGCCRTTRTRPGRPGAARAAGTLTLGEQTKFAGMFRAHGRLVPVWDLPEDAPAAEWEEPVAQFAKRYAEALTVTDPLDAAGRQARQGLLGRQLTLR